MKTIKQILILLLVVLPLGISCSDDDTKTKDTQKSASLRVVFNEMKNNFNIAGRSSSDDDDEMCFDFVYPITLSYNTGTTVTVNSIDELIDLLSNEDEDMYLEAIAFPFQIQYLASGTTVTINSEDDFEGIIAECDFDTYDDDDYIDSECFQLVYPFSIINTTNSETFLMESESQLYAFFEGLDDEDEDFNFDFVYPISVIVDGATVVVSNSYQFEEILNSCDDDYDYDEDCVCTEEYSPVCVIDEDGEVITFPNPCFAECEGYTESDFVDCN
ncbi:hypothetical protein [Flavobacterium sp.]|uniref:hypothetical protein n=1 Tax=Flavobacterium sp. TaxID=239 RepID=UPI0026220F93|nr:hypothetical protein [Flavobacterium sp.]